MELWIGALNLGLLYAFMTMGVFITFRLYQFPDITVDGSFTTGAAVASVLLISGVHPLMALPAAFIAGGLAGGATAFIHTRFRVQGLLAGILVMTALYSVNLHIMGRANIPLLNQKTILKSLQLINPGVPAEVWTCVALLVLMSLFWGLMAFFFKTDLGLFMRATGINPHMAAAQGVHVDRMKLFGIALANALVGLSGALVAQYQGFSDIGMGIGTVVIGMAAVIVGESVFRSRSVPVIVFSVIAGSVIFRLMIACALFMGMNPIDLKFITAAFVLLTLILSSGVKRGGESGKAGSLRAALVQKLRDRRVLVAGAVVLVVAAGIWVMPHWRERLSGSSSSKMPRIGVVQLADNGLLNLTRDGFIAEMERLGYRNGKSMILYLENANGDLPTLNTILDEFIRRKVDIVVPISTAATQTAIQKAKDRPVVFATVASPFIIGAGTSETDHLPNVTGVYGAVPMDKTMEIVRRILPGKLVVGCLWDPSQPNSVLNVTNLQDVIKGYDGVSFEGTTITNSSEVQQAAQSLVYKGIDAFVLAPDNIVYSAFESVVQAAQSKKIPIFCSDVERLADGAFCALGYDYSQSGIQAARLVDRILKGENPRDMPFERYKKLTLGFNQKVARDLGISIPRELLAMADLVVTESGEVVSRKNDDPAAPSQRVATSSAGPSVREPTPKRLALFIFSENPAAQDATKGFMDEMNRDGFLDGRHLTVEQKNAQNEFSLAQSIAQDIVTRRYDYVVTLTTPALQIMAQANNGIPHVFGLVTDPYRAGVARSPEDHPPYLTGIASPQPVASTFELMREVFPKAGKVGLVWNPGEANSETCTMMARKAAPPLGFELVEATVANALDVPDAVNSLVNRGVDLFLTSGDITVMQAFDTVASILRQHRIPYFTNMVTDVDRGALISMGADYMDVGRETGKLAKRVIEGEAAHTIPITEYVPEAIGLNAALAREYGLTFSEELLKRAGYIKE